MDMEFALNTERPISAQAVRRLYDHVGWWPDRSLADIDHVLAEGCSVGAWHGSELVGFARAVSDGKFHAYIEDVVVHEHYRRRDVCTMMLSRLLNELTHIETISLFCEPELTGLYQRQGFKATKQVVMHRKQ
jgi:ribosomal protein S18 acetylase RimI-like enzyme